jgi:hypothetical protein
MEDVGIFYGHLVYFMAILSLKWPFVVFYCHLVYFSRFGKQEKSGNPDSFPGKKWYRNSLQNAS